MFIVIIVNTEFYNDKVCLSITRAIRYRFPLFNTPFFKSIP